MADATADWRPVLRTMSDAYRNGESGRAEELLTTALDLGAPWDVVTSAAAEAMARRRRPGTVVAASAPAQA